MAPNEPIPSKTLKRTPAWVAPVIFLLVLVVGFCAGVIYDALSGVGGRVTGADGPLIYHIAPAIIQVVGGAGAVLFAWWQFRLAHQQREDHLQRTQKQAAEHLALTQMQAQKQLEQTQKQLDEQFRSRQLADQFGDIQNRLASEEPIIRANAALRLAQFGTTLSPSASAGDPRNETNNPYFIPAASQLATALYLEPNPAIRKAVREAIKSLIEFAKGEKPKHETVAEEQPLLLSVIDRLADANRSAKENFIRALAEYTVCQVAALSYASDDSQVRRRKLASLLDLKFVASMAPFCADPGRTMDCLESLMAEGEEINDKSEIVITSTFNVHCLTSDEIYQKLSGEEQKKAIASAIPALGTAARQAIDTRDALAEALVALSAPRHLPKEMEGGSVDLEALQKWIRSKDLKLGHCFLSGAVLYSAEFTVLPGEEVEIVSYSPVNLQGVSIGFAHFQGAHMEGADLKGATIWSSNLRGAYLGGARLQGTNLSWAMLQGTDLRYAQFQGASLLKAQLQGADLRFAQLRGTILYGVSFLREKTDGGSATTLPGDALEVADFAPHGYQDAEADARTKELIEWLKSLQPEPPAGVKEAEERKDEKTPAQQAKPTNQQKQQKQGKRKK